MHPVRRAAALLGVFAAVALLTAGPSAGHTIERERARGFQEMASLQAAADEQPQATPQSGCVPGSNPETDMQGRVPAGTPRGFTCNTSLLSRHGTAGGYKVERFVDKAGHECAYYDTTLLFPSNVQHLSSQPTGVAVLDMSNPAKPVQTATLSTPAMQTPHESLLVNARRGLLAAVMGNPILYPGYVDIYDLNADCRHPALQSSLPVGLLGHESGFAPDGNTFYATSISSGQITAVDVSDPKLPKPVWVGQYPSHGLTISEDGNRAYVADSDTGLVILDVSEIQARKPNPQERVVSRLGWDTMTIPQVAIPVTIGGKAFVVEVDEFSGTATSNGPSANGSRVGAARIIDIQNENAPRVVSNLRLAVNQPENRAKVGGDPGAGSFLQGYAGHYCAVPQRNEPGIVACSFIASGLRVFDIRDPYKPKELAYFVAPLGASSNAGDPSNYAMSSPTFVPERGEIWYSDGNTGFYALRVAEGVWPFGRGAGARRGDCLARRSPIGPRNVGRVRLGHTRQRVLRRIGARPAPRGRYAYRWCVKRSSGSVTAVFSSRSARGRARLVVTTAPRHGMRSVRRGVGVRRLRRRFPRARRLSRNLYRAGPRSRRIFGTRRGKVRFAGVADRGLLRSRRQLRRQLRRAGL